MTQISDHTGPASKARTVTTTDLITGAVNSVRTDPKTQITEKWTVDGNGTGQVVLTKPGVPTQNYRVAGDRIIEAGPAQPSAAGRGWGKFTAGDWITNRPLNAIFRFEKGVATNLYGMLQGISSLTPQGQIEAAVKLLKILKHAKPSMRTVGTTCGINRAPSHPSDSFSRAGRSGNRV
ncbi:hypothetical protein FK268_18055 [Tsukamurella sputi]|uniref:Uncharacterized protein n=1 Tax=Tsukamurella sputi TaxID=2591848 RepID=A0A5C5RIS0_9ACTN|nr:hypothetical protein [Tsukamurella sputi]TWS22907.1 hypothetical protein FK268_18055 [Tsukamurella sputi]